MLCLSPGQQLGRQNKPAQDKRVVMEKARKVWSMLGKVKLAASCQRCFLCKMSCPAPLANLLARIRASELLLHAPWFSRLSNALRRWLGLKAQVTSRAELTKPGSNAATRRSAADSCAGQRTKTLQVVSDHGLLGESTVFVIAALAAGRLAPCRTAVLSC